MRSSFKLDAALGLAAITCASNLAFAQERPTFDLVWEREQGAEACPVRADFIGSVQGRVGRNPFQEGSERQLQVRLSRTPEKWRAEVSLLEAGSVKGSQPIETEGADCTALFSAVVAVAAVMLDAQPTRAVAAESITLEESKQPPRKQPPAPVVPARAARPEPRRADMPDEMPDKRWSLGIEVAQDYEFTRGKNDVCFPGKETNCFEQDGTRYHGYPVQGANNRVTSGWLFGSQRVLIDVQTLLLPRLGLELRAGSVLGAPEFQDSGDDVVPWHLEAGVRYWLARPGAKLRSYIGTGIGYAEFAAKFAVTVQDCGTDPLESETAECLRGERPGTTKKLDAYQRLGLLFVPLRIGAAWNFAGPHSLSFGLSTNLTFLGGGVVLQPNAGYSAAF